MSLIPSRSLRGALSLLLATAIAASCADTNPGTTDDDPKPGGKEDSGWLGSDTFEVGAVVTSIARQEARGEWADLETDPELQARLIDQQLKFIKNKAESHGWRFNQLADTVDVVATSVTDDGAVELLYEAVIDMLGRKNGGVPSLDDIDPTAFVANVPIDPVGFSYSDFSACSQTDGSHSVSDYNFHYYFDPDNPDCELELVGADLTITEVFEAKTVYPEYDQLMGDLEGGQVGFMAALVPNRGDDDPLSRFTAHADMLERELDLVGEDAEDGTYRRYLYKDGGVTMVIDLYDPTKVDWDFARAFRERLGTYTLVHYNGHSAYGTKHLLDDPESFSDRYQIIMMHSCQSYAYYTRQVFRAKETAEDPSGFALADVVATGKSSYPSGSPPTLAHLLASLMEGMAAIDRGERDQAPDWLSILEGMSDATWGDIMYGAAGVRTNSWQP